MSRPQSVPTRPDADENDPPVSPEELAVIRERDKTHEQDRKAARPANEVMERLLRRYPILEPNGQINASG
jgi:hypothetical protein